MIQLKRYAAVAAIALNLSACLGTQDQLAWLDELENQPASEAGMGPCYDTDLQPVATEPAAEGEAAPDADSDAEAGGPDTAEVLEQKEIRIETPCPAQATPEFVASLQRALKARGYYSDEVTGVMGNKTRQAVEIYQTERGLNSEVLSIETARELGLIAYPREEVIAEG